MSSAVEKGIDKATSIGDRVNDAVEQGKAAYREVKARTQTLAGDLRTSGPTSSNP